MYKKHRQNGFTLIEIIIAMIITAFLTLGSFRLISDISQTQRFSKQSFKNKEREFRVLNIIFQDFIHMVPRSVRDELGGTEPAFLLETEDFVVVFTRAGMPTLGPKSTALLRIAYSVKEGKLVRWYWPHLDRPNGEQPIEQELLEDVQEFKVEPWNSSQQKFVSNALAINILPEVVKVTIVYSNGEELEHIIPGIKQ